MQKNERAPLLLLLFWIAATLGWWAFAFAPVSASHEWFTAARNACFGTLENGLPDTYGWMVLILAPGSIFIGLLVTWYDDLKSGLLGLLRQNRGVAIVAVVALAILAEGWMVARKIQEGIRISTMSFRSDEPGELPSEYPRTAIIPREFDLVNQHGQRVKLADLRGKVVLLTFAFAHCQTVCPMLVQQAIEGLDGLDPRKFHLVVITLDPWRDTPKSLPSLAKKWDLPENSWVLSGKVQEVENTIKSFQIPYERDVKSGDVTHPAMTFVIGTDGKLAYTFNNAPPAWLRAASERLAGAVAAE
ncbi:MAG: SCO family protein [Bdellovibrionales bacterium]|nr:SCO family protein [Bdellovibrionales bacterium]